MARLFYTTDVIPHERHRFQNVGSLGTSCTDALATYSNDSYGWVYVKTDHNSGQYFRAWGYGKNTNYEGIVGGDSGGSGPYGAGMCSNGGTIGIQTSSAAGASHACSYHTLKGNITADAAYNFQAS